MEIAIIGSGNVGGNLGRRLAEAGHAVCFGVRDPTSERALAAGQLAGSPVLEVSEAVASAALIVLATPFGSIEDVLAATGPMTGKIVVDATNPVRWDNGPVSAAPTSGAEVLAAKIPDARVVKAFNTLGAEHLLDPRFGEHAADVYVVGDDPEARAQVGALARQIGFEPVDLGPLRNARLVEAIALSWIHLATVGGQGRQIAFKLLRR